MNRLREIHANAIINGKDITQFLIQKLLEIPNILYAQKVFDNIPHPHVSLYNILIKSYCSNGPYHNCISLYIRMLSRGCYPYPHTFTLLFASAARLSSSKCGQMFHAQYIKWCFEFDSYALTALADMYSKMGLMHFARKQFDEMERRDVPAWNSLIAGYAKRGNMEAALELFRAMPSRNVISWTAVISGYSQNGKYDDALAMYLEMEKEELIRPNEVTMASVLPACANLGALEIGQRIEAYASANGYFKNMYVCNAVLEMYSRCGRIDTAMKLFDEIGRRRNLCSWNSMIMGLAAHGKCIEALNFFDNMQGEGIRPDDVTFVGAILACTHGGMVKRGRELFKSMEARFSVTPKLEHYGCMVDLLGRAGELEEAYNLIQRMPMKPDSVIWGTLLGACSFHGNVEFAEIAAEHLFDLEPRNPGNYVILSNIYARKARWDGVAKMRKFMKGFQITKAAGYSFIEGEGGQVHKFIVEDKSHPRFHDIYGVLDVITFKIKFHEKIEFDSLLEEFL
ncbi:hypothetical protein LIER_16901 [Lithospermum erythrorhizon]|uniref:Pentatricopeptide repeat-containing protein n=1 Tax=Lithospermum erythrorhizon TaxID=34254 RepID=A0AAV3Q8D6_LITER